MRVLVLNSGSSSQKSALYEIEDKLPLDPPIPLWHAEIEWNAQSATLRAHGPADSSQEETIAVNERGAAIEHMLQTLWSGRNAAIRDNHSIDAVGHRVVHGGPHLAEPVVINSEIKQMIVRAAVFAPLHNRAELEGIESIERILGNVPQIAVFDTGFHRSLPPHAAIYPGPYEWFEQGIRRYGFHGINYQYCAGRAAQLIGRDPKSLKIVCCHLGNGCSLAAINSGRSVDTTMGFTPLDGLMMGTRSGSVDPGILTYLMRDQHLTGGDIDSLLNGRSGLLGISGVSSDMRDVLSAMRDGNDRARLAFDIFVHRLVQGIAAMVASLEGIDVLVFTAGIGEYSREVRSAACEKLKFLGLEVDSEMDLESGDRTISTKRSKATVLVLHAQEDWEIAKVCAQLIRSCDPSSDLIATR